MRMMGTMMYGYQWVSTPSDYQTPQYIPNHGKMCLTKDKEEAEYVYQSVKNGT